MAVFFESSEGAVFPKIRKLAVKQWIGQIAHSLSKRLGEVSYRFCSDKEILLVNNQYLKHDYYTDIITFDYSEGDLIAGDIFISLDTVGSNAVKYGVDYQKELHRVIIHGVLHLCGLKDKTDEEARQMRQAEDAALQLYGFEI